MSTLLLESNGGYITDGDLSFLPKPITDMRIGYVVTASKGVPDISYIDDRRSRMRKMGYDFDEIDISGKTPAELRDFFVDKDIILVEGGNTFLLMKAIRESGFEIVVRECLERGVIYIGSSAGAYVACPTIEMATWEHQDIYDHYGVTDLSGMNLVPFLVSVHYEQQYASLLRQKIAKSTFPVRILKNGQALLVRNEETTLLGTGEEVRL